MNLAQIGGLVIALTLANTVFLNNAEKQIADILPNASSDEVKSAISASRSALLQSLPRDIQQQFCMELWFLSPTHTSCVRLLGL